MRFWGRKIAVSFLTTTDQVKGCTYVTQIEGTARETGVCTRLFDTHFFLFI